MNADLDNSRDCLDCRQPFSGRNPPVEFRELQRASPDIAPGVEVVLLGGVCAGCARGEPPEADIVTTRPLAPERVSCASCGHGGGVRKGGMCLAYQVRQSDTRLHLCSHFADREVRHACKSP